YRIRGWKNWAARLLVYLGILVAIRWLLWRGAGVKPWSLTDFETIKAAAIMLVVAAFIEAPSTLREVFVSSGYLTCMPHRMTMHAIGAVIFLFKGQVWNRFEVRLIRLLWPGEGENRFDY